MINNAKEHTTQNCPVRDHTTFSLKQPHIYNHEHLTFEQRKHDFSFVTRSPIKAGGLQAGTRIDT